jgi:hypothetical protein
VSKTYKYILDFEAQTGQVQKKVGGLKGILKGAALAAGALFAASKVMDAAKAVADYAKEISKVNDQITKLTGLQDAAADAMTGQVQAIAKAYEQDVNASLMASNALMKSFGDSSRDAFNVLNAGFATTANSNEDFLKQVSEYSIHFKEAGLAASQMVAIIAEGNKMGVFDDKAADAIKEGGIRLREMTQSTQDALNMIGLSSKQIQNDISSGNKSMFEVMQLVSRQLQTLPQQSPAVGAALADIFGGPGEDGIQFIRTLADINTNLDDVVSQAGGAAAAQMKWADELAEFHTIGAQVFGGTGKMITNVKAIMLGWVNDGIKGIANMVNWFIDLYNESMVFRGAIEYIKLTFKTTFDFIGTIFSNFWEQLKGLGKLLKAVFTGDFKAIPGIIKEAFNNTLGNFEEFGLTAASNFTEGFENTLNPRKKIELIGLSTEAEAAGIEAGQKMAAGFAAGMRGIDDAKVGGGGADIPVKLNLEEMQKEMPLFQENMAAMGEYLDQLREKQMAVQYAFEDGFMAIGQSIVDGLGLGESGFEGFLGKMIQTATQLIAIYAAQAIAGSVSNATQSAAATGPAAIVTQPAFMATLIGGVLAAFAAIPKFELGGVVPGSSFTGDKMLARLNSGEEVLRRDDPRHRNNYGEAGRNRDRIIIPTAKIRKGDIYISYHEAEKEILMRT